MPVNTEDARLSHQSGDALLTHVLGRLLEIGEDARCSVCATGPRVALSYRLGELGVANSARRGTHLVPIGPGGHIIADRIHTVECTAYMDFQDAIDRLGERVTHEQVARALGVSVASVRQYRLSPKAKAHRTPPEAWQKVLTRLAKERSRELKALADDLERSMA